MLRSVILISCALALPLQARAEIEKFAVPTQTGTRAVWWPKLTPVEGWHHERNASLGNAINLLVPDGATFANAETVVYGRALYKPRDPATTSVQVLIDRAQADLRRATPDIGIAEAAPAVIADGTALRTFTFTPKSSGNWERVAYGEDGDYYLLFVVSSRTRQGFEGAKVAFESIVKSYTREPQATASPAQAPAAAPATAAAAPDWTEPRK
jgi:hypothetical protein